MIFCGEHRLLCDISPAPGCFFPSLCSFRFEYRSGGHCLRCFNKEQKKKTEEYRYSPSKSFVIIYVYIFSFQSTNFCSILSFSLHSLSGGSLLFKYHPSCFFHYYCCCCQTMNLKKTTITFHVVIWYRFFLRMSSGTLFMCDLSSMEMALLIFVLISRISMAHAVWACERKTRPNERHLNWNESSSLRRWFMIKILRNLSFICFRNVLAFVYKAHFSNEWYTKRFIRVFFFIIPFLSLF